MSPRPTSNVVVAITTSSFAIGFIVAWQWKRRREKNAASPSPEVKRLRQLLASSRLLHPWLSCEHFQDANPKTSKARVANFTDLAAALAASCGVVFEKDDPIRQGLVKEIDGLKRRHVLFCLCDGMGNSILDQHLDMQKSFLHNHQNKSFSLRAVFPSTTPAALATLATAQWPGRHGMPGWDLREQTNCDYPGEANGIIHQLRVLAPNFTNCRTNEPVDSWYQTSDRVFVEKPWAGKIREKEKAVSTMPCQRRRMIYINAYNGDEVQDWSQGDTSKRGSEDTVSQQKPHGATDFSSWQMGQANQDKIDNDMQSCTLFDTATIGETAYNTLGQPEGAQEAVQFFRDGIDAALRAIADAEASGDSTFVYLYTAHPDKHMHALGTTHAQVEAVVRGIDNELKRMWNVLGNRNVLLSACASDNEVKTSGLSKAEDSGWIDAALVVSADHGHVTVEPNEMIVLPPSIIDCLEYANVGVFGPGRHAYLHCRAGLQSRLRELWRATKHLKESFILLTIEEAVDNALFGPDPPSPAVRPRMGDFVAISTNSCTLVSPKEASKYTHCRGAHGSLLTQEMSIPFVTCVPP